MGHSAGMLEGASPPIGANAINNSGILDPGHKSHTRNRMRPWRFHASDRPRLLAVASGGGHWIELARLRPAFEDFDTAFVSMFENYLSSLPGHRYYTIDDSSRFQLLAMIPVFFKSMLIMLRERPHAIVTTGSAPMLSFILIGRLFGVRTLWIDSIANPECLSTSGRIASKLAHRCVSQWEEVAEKEGLECWGRIV